jgi:hypothetical protein
MSERESKTFRRANAARHNREAAYYKKEIIRPELAFDVIM